MVYHHTMPPLYTVQLLKTVKTDGGVFKEGSWQYAWVDAVGFIWLRSRTPGWEFSSCAHPGVDFRWHGDVDPRSAEERTKYEARFKV